MLNEAITEQAFSLFMTLSQGKPEYEVNYHGLGIYPKSKFKYNGNACDDIMKYIDYDFRCLQESRNNLRAIYKSIYDTEIKTQYDFIKFCDEARHIASILNDDFPMLSEVLLVFIENVFQSCGDSNEERLWSMAEIWYQVDTIIVVQNNLTNTLTYLANEQLNAKDRHNLPVLDSLTSFNAKVNIEYTNGELSYTYYVDSVEKYFFILITTYIMTKPRIAICNYCNRFFIPKTNRVTLYCDRATPSGSTCKKVGASEKFKSNIQNDEVLGLYKNEKHRIRMFCRRSQLNHNDPMNDIYDWLDIFEPMIEKYRAGDIPADEVLKALNEQSKNFQPMPRYERYLMEW